MDEIAERPLRGRLVVTTRDEAGELERRLAELGARVHHLPLIRIVDADEHDIGFDGDGHIGGPGSLSDALAGVGGGVDGDGGWLMVTSRHGALRCIEALAEAPLGLRLAAVGVATAAVLAEQSGRSIELIPERQTAAGLLEAFADHVDQPQDIVVAQAQQAAPTLVEGLRAAGHRVRVVTLYRTELLEVTPEQWSAARAADAVTLMSGTAARAWSAAQSRTDEPIAGPPDGPLLCAIGPSTAEVAASVGLVDVSVATEHSIDGLLGVLIDSLGSAPVDRTGT
jgi:uroporphyrinogen-III synthase